MGHSGHGSERPNTEKRICQVSLMLFMLCNRHVIMLSSARPAAPSPITSAEQVGKPDRAVDEPVYDYARGLAA